MPEDLSDVELPTMILEDINASRCRLGGRCVPKYS
jgi:hypothetical protein